jgi:hypothetical protein
MTRFTLSLLVMLLSGADRRKKIMRRLLHLGAKFYNLYVLVPDPRTAATK